MPILPACLSHRSSSARYPAPAFGGSELPVGLDVAGRLEALDDRQRRLSEVVVEENRRPRTEGLPLRFRRPRRVELREELGRVFARVHGHDETRGFHNLEKLAVDGIVLALRRTHHDPVPAARP